MRTLYGLWHRGIKPSEWMPDYDCCETDEIERWKADLKKEEQGYLDFEGFYGIGVYELK